MFFEVLTILQTNAYVNARDYLVSA